MPPEDTKRQSVLVVDDEAQVAIALADLLERDFTVVTETSPLAALERLRAANDFSVIVSDQRMPAMSGDQLFAAARTLSLASRILITGYADISAVIEAVNNGQIYGYLTKPWKPQDILLTVHRAAERTLLHRKVLDEQALLHQLLAASVDAIAIKDSNHRYLRLNRAESRLLGVPDSAEIEGRCADEFLPAERTLAIRDVEQEVLRSGRAMLDRLEQVTDGSGRSRWFSANLAPVRSEGGKITGLVKITRDVTGVRELDEMKDQFIATVRHELRTPLTAMRGALGLLQSGAAGALGARARHMIEISNRNCHALLGLVNDLLDAESMVGGTLTLERRTHPLADIVAGAVAVGRDRAGGTNVEILAGGLPEAELQIEIHADRDRLLQVLGKLIANALAVAPARSQIVVSAVLEAGKVRFSVADRGPGIPEALREHVFSRFTQIDSSSARPKGGVGLGLFIARSIVLAHGGTIDFVARPGGGTEFFFDLPVGFPNAPTAAART